MNKKNILKSINFFTKEKLFKLVSYSPEYKPIRYVGGVSTKHFNLVCCKNIIFGKYLTHLDLLRQDKIKNSNLKFKNYTILLNDSFIFEGKYKGLTRLPKKYCDYSYEKHPYIGSGVNSNEGMIFTQGEEYLVVAPHLIKVFEIISGDLIS